MARIAVIPGDGVGQEVTPEGVRLLETVAARRGLDLEIEVWHYGADYYLATGETLPAARLEALRSDYRAVLLGAMGDPRVPDQRHAREIVMGLRFGLELYVNLRPARLLADRLSPLKGKGGPISTSRLPGEHRRAVRRRRRLDQERHPDEIAINEDVNTHTGVSRIIRAAFEYACRTGRRRVCMSNKSNAMRYAGDLWQRRWRAIGAEYPEIEQRHLYVDALCGATVPAPERPAEWPTWTGCALSTRTPRRHYPERRRPTNRNSPPISSSRKSQDVGARRHPNTAQLVPLAEGAFHRG